ncbi:protein DnrP [Pseudomonas sp. Irchel s3h17]|uniref:protein DnrP n=1 Tax=Pseudomonas sp. Irchel s3h17 TaxID=2009182 RepID=UPI000BA3516F|nr:protein DnrP [Pseudomonas sp. Irchel s3h17]
MNALPACLYCQHPHPPRQTTCSHCGMPLSALANGARQRTLRRFRWFCIGLSIFCVTMFFWLPRG